MRSPALSLSTAGLALLISSGLVSPVPAGGQVAPDSHVRERSTDDPNADDLFRPLFAAPREVSSYLSVLSWTSPDVDTRVASMGVGDAFPLARWGQASVVRGRLAVEFGVLAQFDLDGVSFDFINADFFVGVPVSLRRGDWAARARLYHWSAHLGDEFLLRSGLEREEVSVETIELLVSRDLGAIRLVGGGLKRLRRFPKALGSGLLRAGVELRPERPFADAGAIGSVRGLAALDIRLTNAGSWSAGYSAKAGVEVTPSGPGRRSWSLVLELFDGPSPYGQFFRTNLRFFGVGLHLR